MLPGQPGRQGPAGKGAIVGEVRAGCVRCRPGSSASCDTPAPTHTHRGTHATVWYPGCGALRPGPAPRPCASLGATARGRRRGWHGGPQFTACGMDVHRTGGALHRGTLWPRSSTEKVHFISQKNKKCNVTQAWKRKDNVVREGYNQLDRQQTTAQSTTVHTQPRASTTCFTTTTARRTTTNHLSLPTTCISQHGTYERGSRGGDTYTSRGGDGAPPPGTPVPLAASPAAAASCCPRGGAAACGDDWGSAWPCCCCSSSSTATCVMKVCEPASSLETAGPSCCQLPAPRTNGATGVAGS